MVKGLNFYDFIFFCLPTRGQSFPVGGSTYVLLLLLLLYVDRDNKIEIDTFEFPIAIKCISIRISALAWLMAASLYLLLHGHYEATKY